MIAFYTLAIGLIAGFAIGWAVNSAALDLAAQHDPSQFPPATARRIRRAQKSARADLRRALGRQP